MLSSQSIGWKLGKRHVTMKILFINPFGSNWVEGMEDKTETAIRMAPMGILSIAAYLEQQGVETAIHDCHGPVTLVGTADVHVARCRIPTRHGGVHRGHVELFECLSPGRGDQAGGPAYQDHRRRGACVSAARKDPRDQYPAIDYLVTGEGEKAMAELAAGAEPGSIQGLGYRLGAEIKDNGLRTDLVELDTLTVPGISQA